MTDLRDRFRSFDRIPAPDRWADVTRRAQGANVDGPVRLGPALGRDTARRSAPTGRVARLGWVLAGAVLLIAVLAAALLAGALRSEPRPDLSSGPFGPTG